MDDEEVILTLEALKDYLKAKGYDNIYLDVMPAEQTQPQAIALVCWDHTVGQINDGTGVRYVQIQVRRDGYRQAKQDCRALFQLLDSGAGETVFQLSPAISCIARPLRGPLQLEQTDTTTTFYCEIALWGEN